MASISNSTLKMAAELYQQVGVTWTDVVKQLAKTGRHHSRKHLQAQCQRKGYLAEPGHKLCQHCKHPFPVAEDEVNRRRFCPKCRKHDLRAILSAIARRPRGRREGEGVFYA